MALVRNKSVPTKISTILDIFYIVVLMLKTFRKIHSYYRNFMDRWNGLVFEAFKDCLDWIKERYESCKKAVLSWVSDKGVQVKKYWDKRTNPHLSSRVGVEKRKLAKLPRFKGRSIIRLYQPSVSSFIVILVVFIGLYILSVYLQDILEYFVSLLPASYQFPVYQFPTVDTDSNHYQNLLGVLAVIGGIVFALAIFIAESFRDSTTDRGRVLLRESLIWPLTVSVIISSFLFLLGDKNYAIFVPIVGVGLLSLYALKRVIAILLNRVAFLDKRRKLLNELFQKSIDSAIETRLADNILLTGLDSGEIKLKYYPFYRDKGADYVEFKTNKLGKITNIHLLKLERFAEVLDKYARNNNFYFDNEKEEPSKIYLNENGTSTTEKNTLIPNSNRFLMRKNNDEIDEEHNTLICFERKLIGDDENAERELRSIFSGIFEVGEGSFFSEEARTELRNLKEELISAVKSDKSDEVGEIVKTYIFLVEGYLEHMAQHGGIFNYEQAKKERSSLWMGGWSEIRWLAEDIYEVLELAVKHSNKEVVRGIAYLPIAISRRAIEKHDHYSFQEFIRLVEMLYVLSAKEGVNKDLSEFLKDRSWRHLREIVSLYIQYRIEDGNHSQETIKSYEGFVVHSLHIFKNLIEMSFKSKDFEYFTTVVNEVTKLMSYGHFERYAYEVDRLQYIIDEPGVDKKEKIKASEKLSRVKAISDFWKEFESRRKQMLFGVGTLVFDRYQRVLEKEVVKPYFDKISAVQPSNLDKFTSLFLECHTFEVEDFWKWDSWDLIPDAGVQNIQVLEKLEKFYAVKALQMVASLQKGGEINIELPTNRELVYLVEGSRDLMSTLEDVEKNSKKWSFILNENAIKSVEALRTLLTDAKERQIEANIQEKINRSISEKKVTSFINEAIKHFNENVYTIPFFEYIGSYQDSSLNCEGEVLKEEKRLGINQVDEKAVFIEDWHEGYGMWGENYGESMAKGLDKEVFTKLLDAAEQRSYEDLNLLISELGDPENVVLVSTGRIRKLYFSNEDKQFIPYWDNTAPKCEVRGFSGWYKYKDKLIPVFEVYHGTDNQLLVMRKNNGGVIYEQQCPLYEGEMKGKVRGGFYFDIRAFSENPNLLKEMLGNPPDWLKEEGDFDAQKKHLLQRVLIKVFARYKLKFVKNTKLFKVGFDN